MELSMKSRAPKLALGAYTRIVRDSPLADHCCRHTCTTCSPSPGEPVASCDAGKFLRAPTSTVECSEELNDGLIFWASSLQEYWAPISLRFLLTDFGPITVWLVVLLFRRPTTAKGKATKASSGQSAQEGRSPEEGLSPTEQ
jgi:hypothetical protein